MPVAVITLLCLLFIWVLALVPEGVEGLATPVVTRLAVILSDTDWLPLPVSR